MEEEHRKSLNSTSTSDTEDQSSTYSSLNRRNLRPPAYAFILPNLEKFPEDFRRFIEHDIIEIATLRRLETSGHLNWWCGQNPSQRLWPLITTGDGNCLLHAASLGIWGVHDRQLNLRQLLHDALTVSERKTAFYRRWRYYESKANLKSELILSETEWSKEWKDILNLTSTTPRIINSENGSNTNEQIYESLELIHVYALANVLKRPIIIVSDTVLRNPNGEALSPISFGGIFLPLEIVPQHCHRSPLVLCYDSSHFSPLVTMRQINSNCLQAVPIVDRNRDLLPLHFAIDPGSSFTWWKDMQDQRVAAELDSLQTDDKHLELICKYMDVVKMDLRRGSVKKTIPVQNGSEFAPSVPQKLLTLASGSEPNNNGHASRIFTEIRQHFRWLSKRSKRKHNKLLFSANELRQSNCVLTVLLHNFPHQYIDSMLQNYITSAKKRFERSKVVPPSAITPKKNRISRSFSSSSVLLTCLNTHCNKTASTSTNFLCSMCFEDQKREMVSIGSANTSPNSTNSQKENNTGTVIKVDYKPGQIKSRTEYSKSPTMPALSQINSNNVHFNDMQHCDKWPIRYVDESASASSTTSSRKGTRYVSPSATLTRYFYRKDNELADKPIILASRPYCRSFDYDTPSSRPYNSSPSYHHTSTSLVLNSTRAQKPTFYAPHSLPRVSLSSYRNHEYPQKLGLSSPENYPLTTSPNVSCSMNNGLKNKFSSNNGVSFYYSAS